MTSLTHDELRELTGLYVLGALTRDERLAFETHLATCAECTHEVRSLRPVVGGLSRTVPLHEPPANLRSRVLAAVAGAPGAGEKVMSRRPRPPLATWGLPWLAAAACALLALGLGIYAAQLRSRVRDLEARLQEATIRAAAADRQIADARRTALEAQSTVAILAAPDLARIDLAGQKVAPEARARAFWSRTRGLVFSASNLPALPPGKVYQLWVVTAQAPVSAGLLRPDASGGVTAVIDTPRDIPQPVAMAVTLEPDGGVPAPSGERYLVGALGS